VDAAAMHRAFESVWRQLFDKTEVARYECRSDLTVYLFPALPLSQANGPWVEEDSQAAVEALPDAVAEVEATGVQVWVQTGVA
jgi:hypothetical protein